MYGKPNRVAFEEYVKKQNKMIAKIHQRVRNNGNNKNKYYMELISPYKFKLVCNSRSLDVDSKICLQIAYVLSQMNTPMFRKFVDKHKHLISFINYGKMIICSNKSINDEIKTDEQDSINICIDHECKYRDLSSKKDTYPQIFDAIYNVIELLDFDTLIDIKKVDKMINEATNVDHSLDVNVFKRENLRDNFTQMKFIWKQLKIKYKKDDAQLFSHVNNVRFLFCCCCLQAYNVMQ